jgi:nicotinate-nucleotide pyrophosphorylase (carboxylating)
MNDLKAIVQAALQEDIGAGDWTTRLLLAPQAYGSATVAAKTNGVMSGITVFTEVFRQLDESITVGPRFTDGQTVKTGDIVIEMRGPLAPILTGERVALNFLQRLSGIATLTKSYVEAVHGSRALILDTRKTTPNLRFLEKAAVVHGGGQNHRQGLYDMILIKDNHVFACGGISAAIQQALVESRNIGLRLPIEVEVKDLNDLDEALNFSSDLERIMLDNFDLETIRIAVMRTAGRVPLEVSGGVNLACVRDYALAGVDYISVGALTHSAPALDLSLLILE